MPHSVDAPSPFGGHPPDPQPSYMIQRSVDAAHFSRPVLTRRVQHDLKLATGIIQQVGKNVILLRISGRTHWWLLPTVTTEIFTLALQHFAQAVGASPQKHIVLVLDRAGWHTSKMLSVPEGLHLLFPPPYSPELQPAEHLWPLSNEPLVNRHFHDLDELEEVQAQRCVLLQDSPDLIRSYTSFHWWPHPREQL